MRELCSPSRATLRYCSIWSEDIKREPPSVSKPDPDWSSGRLDESMVTPRISFIEFSYSRRFSRRMSVFPPASLSSSLASTNLSESISRNANFSCGLGCVSSSGGISWALRAPRICCHLSASFIVFISKEKPSLSSRVLPLVFLALWHSVQ